MNREILKLAIPNIISNVSVPLLSTVDTILMGQLSGLHLGAVGIGSMIFNFLYWNFGFLRMGTTGLTAQAYGKKNDQEMIVTLGRALVTGLALGIVMILLYLPIWELSSVLMNISPEHMALVKSYFTIRILAAPATFALFSLMGWYFGMQNAIYPLIITVFLNLVNIGISALLVLYFNMEVEGVALGTLIAQYLGLILALVLLLLKYKFLLSLLSVKLIFIRDELLAFFTLNKDIFLRTIFLSLVFAFFYSQSSKFGELVLASSVILLQLLNWMSYGIDGFAFAAESLTGKYQGAADERKLRKTIRYVLYWGAGLGLLYSLVYWIAETPLIRLFSNEVSVQEATAKYYLWIVILPIVGFASYIWDGIFVGLTAVKSMRNSMFLSFIFYFATYYGLQPIMGIQALWLALLTFLLARGLIQSYLFWKKGSALR
jgi:MATE family multidrug resistance protein